MLKFLNYFVDNLFYLKIILVLNNIEINILVRIDIDGE